MKRFSGPLGKIAERFFSARGNPAETEPGKAQPAAAKPLVSIFRAAEDSVAVTEELFAHVRKLEGCLSDIREQAGVAWQEQSRATKEYYDLARGVLLALDDLRALADQQPILNDLAARLEALLRKQDMTPIPVASGDSFCADIHVCGKTEPSPKMPPGRVLAVLSPGYRRRLSSGESVVVRAVQVVVSQSPVEPEESTP
jgi:hypothetical protein